MGTTALGLETQLPVGSVPAVQNRWRRPFSVVLVLLLWFVVYFDPHRWLTVYLPDAVEKLPLLLFVTVLVVAVPRFPPRDWFVLYLVFLFGMFVMLPFAPNRGLARDATKVMVLGYVLALTSMALIKRLRDVMPIFVIIVAAFGYWAVVGGREGRVVWHPFYANQDGFGPLMVMGMGFSYYLGQAARSRALKYFCFLAAGFCLFGIITSFARGAVLSAAALAALVWVRSPHKLRTLGAGILGAALLFGSVRVLFPEGQFWKEMESSFTEGTEEGTGADRWWLWQAAMKIYTHHPVFGVGPGNFGVAAADLPSEEVEGDYKLNPRQLYGKNTHSIYFTILSEQGTWGVIAFLLLMADFWRRQFWMRRQLPRAVFREETGGAFNLNLVVLALEAAMLGYLLSGFFYAQHAVHWCYSLLSLNALLHVTVRATVRARQAQALQPAA